MDKWEKFKEWLAEEKTRNQEINQGTKSNAALDYMGQRLTFISLIQTIINELENRGPFEVDPGSGEKMAVCSTCGRFMKWNGHFFVHLPSSPGKFKSESLKEPKTGMIDICLSCGKEIIFLENHWDHRGSYKPGHVAWPVCGMMPGAKEED